MPAATSFRMGPTTFRRHSEEVIVVHSPKLTLIAILSAAVVLGVIVPVSRCAAYGIRRFVMANGATPSAGLTGSGRALLGTAGQAVVAGSSGTYGLCHGYWCLGGPNIVAVDDPPPGLVPTLPAEFALGAPAPNPAAGGVAFLVALPSESYVELTVLDLQGRVVRRLDAGRLPAGRQRVKWDGQTEAGVPATGGLYFARLTVSGRVIATRRVILRR